VASESWILCIYGMPSKMHIYCLWKSYFGEVIFLVAVKENEHNLLRVVLIDEGLIKSVTREAKPG
jgi:hypothetical protein